MVTKSKNVHMVVVLFYKIKMYSYIMVYYHQNDLLEHFMKVLIRKSFDMYCFDNKILTIMVNNNNANQNEKTFLCFLQFIIYSKKSYLI